MKNNSRIRFSPVTKEIEIEGTEEFVKTYFDKLQAMIFWDLPRKKDEAVKAAPAKEEPEERTAKAKGCKRTWRKESHQYRYIVGLIQASTEGISTADLKEKTGLSERQIWSIVNRAAKVAKSRK